MTMDTNQLIDIALLVLESMKQKPSDDTTHIARYFVRDEDGEYVGQHVIAVLGKGYVSLSNRVTDEGEYYTIGYTEDALNDEGILIELNTQQYEALQHIQSLLHSFETDNPNRTDYLGGLVRTLELSSRSTTVKG